MIDNEIKILMKNVSNTIIETCKQKSITLDELSIRSGIKKSKIEDIINLKEIDPNVTILARIFNVLDISLYEIFSKSDPKSFTDF